MHSSWNNFVLLILKSLSLQSNVIVTHGKTFRVDTSFVTEQVEMDLSNPPRLIFRLTHVVACVITFDKMPFAQKLHSSNSPFIIHSRK